jgi:hypothetical protein
MKVLTKVVHQAVGETVAQEISQNNDFQAELIKATFPLQLLIVVSIVTAFYWCMTYYFHSD